jgi:acyl-ACP thioesterase
MQVITPELMVWNEPLKMRLHDVDFNGRATVASVCWHFLDAAWSHAQALGVGNDALGQMAKFWVLSRLRIEVRHFPVWGVTGSLRTWPRGVTHVFAMRDFELLDPAGAVLMAGSSAWLVLDMKTRRPQRISKILPGFENLENRAALGRDPEKLPEGTAWDRQSAATVRYMDLDVNGHMNSSRYLGLILDAYPVEFHRTHSVRALEVNYLDETRAGETVAILTRQSGPDAFAHSMIKEDGTEVCRVCMEWNSTPGPSPALPS